MLGDGFVRFVIVAAKDNSAIDHRAGADQAAHANNAVHDDCTIQDAAIGDDRVINLRSIDLTARQEAWPTKDRRAHVKKIKPRQLIGYIQISLEKGADGPDVLPISLKHIGENAIV